MTVFVGLCARLLGSGGIGLGRVLGRVRWMILLGAAVRCTFTVSLLWLVLGHNDGVLHASDALKVIVMGVVAGFRIAEGGGGGGGGGGVFFFPFFSFC